MKKKKQDDPLENERLNRAAIVSFFRLMLIKEAAASVALDKDPNCHTCNPECDEYPGCPASKRGKLAQTQGNFKKEKRNDNNDRKRNRADGKLHNRKRVEQ